MKSTWEHRDLPVLEAVVTIDERDGGVNVDLIPYETGFDMEEVQRALRALEHADPPYFHQTQKGDGQILFLGATTSHARRAVGAWPSAESMAGQLVAAMNDAADREDDPQQKSRLKQVAAYLGNAGRDAAVDISAAMISRQLGGI